MVLWSSPDSRRREGWYDMIWFSSDTHYNHAKIIEYCERPYADVDAMNDDLIQRWNARVAPEDTVYFIGDFAMGLPDHWSTFSRRLAGTKILIKGNHDRIKRLESEEVDAFFRKIGFAEVHTNLIREIEGTCVWMNHYPLASDDDRDLKRPPAPGPYDIAVCGHIHRHWKVRDGVVNVGVDVWDFRPVSLAEIKGW